MNSGSRSSERAAPSAALMRSAALNAMRRADISARSFERKSWVPEVKNPLLAGEVEQPALAICLERQIALAARVRHGCRSEEAPWTAARKGSSLKRTPVGVL